MDLVTKKVKHGKFGVGTIVAQDSSYVSIKFDSETEIKKFIYPACFKSFLTLLDGAAAAQIGSTIEKQEEANRAQKEKERREAETRVFQRQQQAKNSRSTKTVDLRPFRTVADFCDNFKRALSSEIYYLRTTGGKRQNIYDGKRIEVKNSRYVYTFITDDELNYPEGTQISMWQGETSTPGLVVGCENFTIIISTGTNFGIDVPLLEFSAEPWRLMSFLMDRMDDMLKEPSEIVRALVCDGHKVIDFGNRHIATGQDVAVKMAQTQPITFVWGPPGTGKTQTLAKIALAHIEQGHRVLMLSYSNVSVDGAIMRVHSLSKEQNAGVLLRYGYPRRSDLLEHEYLTSYNLAMHNHPDLMQEHRALVAELKKTSRMDSRYIKIRKRLTEIRNELAQEEKDSVDKAMFVATTVSKTVVDSTIRNSEFDVVIFDEASMAYIPQIIFAASLAKKHFICMGDFRQLPPIVQSNNTSYLNADIFQYCGITTAVDSSRNHKWLCMLDTQYRMHPRIADFASVTMYGGLLKSAEGMEQQRQSIASSKPVVGSAIGFADLTGMMSVCSKTADNSRVNVLSAFISFALALEAAKVYEVGIITPYHAQSRLLHAMARDAAELEPSLQPISCATVHQFQGSEKDVIVYDAVDCYRMPFPGMLLTATRNNYANRLFNVALTRAKGKFVGVANVSYMDNKNLSKGLMFKRMIETQRRKNSCHAGQELIHSRRLGNSNIMQFYTDDTGVRDFVKDILAAKREIRVDIPDRPTDNSTLTEITKALQIAKTKGVKVYVRSENKQHLPLALKPLAIETPFVVNPVVTIDKTFVWFGMPASAADFISEGRIIKTTHRPIIRFIGAHAAASIYGFMEMSRTVDQSNTIDVDESGHAVTDNFANYVLAHKKCPSCGKPMKMQKSKKGKFFLSCTGYPACHETAFVDVNLVEQYFYRNSKSGQHCTKCNCSLEAKLGQYGLYIQCCGMAHHKYKLDEI